MAALLEQIGGREIDGDAPGGSASPIAARAARTRSRDSPTALSGNPDDGEGRKPRRDGDLGLDLDRVDALERHRADARDQDASSCRLGASLDDAARPGQILSPPQSARAHSKCCRNRCGKQ